MSTAAAPPRRPLAAAGALVAGPALFAGSLVAGRLGAVCPSQLLGIDCPLCGGTRATLALLDGRFLDAVDHNALVTFVVLPVLVALVVIAAWRLFTGAPPRPTTRRSAVLSWALIALALAFWAVRNLSLEATAWLHSGLQL